MAFPGKDLEVVSNGIPSCGLECLLELEVGLTIQVGSLHVADVLLVR